MAPLKVGISLGDPGGIGPEVVLKALSERKFLPQAHYILFGSRWVVEKEEKSLGIRLNPAPLDPSSLSQSQDPGVWLYEVETPLEKVIKGASTKEQGQASFLYFQKAVKEAQKGTLQALVTAPISKHSWRLAGIQWPGHTEYLNQIFPQAIMSFWSPKVKVALYTHHLPLEEALKKVKQKPLLQFLLHLHRFIENIQPGRYSYLMAGLNPHAGEDGMLGSEEREEIKPALIQAQNKGMPVEGPFPPDVVFRKALHFPHKIVIGLYHDQALIPFKLEAFDEGVNATLGLSFIRTSPDHGTAFDIAEERKASPRSLREAIQLAGQLSPKPGSPSS
ncbi:4-hydroxythreonine-4-phosphate dehydrogenase PdxA [bacterium]|nr:4-hydroxythreonine-4-phosphate dehydrogenase PdxA [bacterium]